MWLYLNMEFLHSLRGGGDVERGYNAILENGEYIKNCNLFITEEMVNECCGNTHLIEQSALLEGAKLDMQLKNLFKEGKDYKNLKKDVKEIIKANDMDDDDLKSKGKGFIHVCKRILQVCEDLAVFVGGAGAAANTVTGIGIIAAGLTPVGVGMIIGAIVSFVVTFIASRLFRLLWDTLEFNAIKDDAESIVRDLRRMAKNTNDKKLSEKYNAEADKLEASIDKYSKKRKNRDDD